MYVMTCSRPDVSYALSMVSHFQDNLGRAHWSVVRNIVKYLCRRKTMFLVLSDKDDFKVRGYSDAIFKQIRIIVFLNLDGYSY